jgi:hypothetical protein
MNYRKKIIPSENASTNDCILIRITNLFIEYRNIVYEGVVNLHTGVIEDEEDAVDVDAMDKEIDMVINFLTKD